ncbi:uncharacterized protein LOC116776749 [Danaus plexippus]|uniref:uncharacterized protein LOC116776749 n=1 Tax=Danaus plexippus TaxID=13037 RepID=UPI002AB29B16|nr:uncharacterized protein LOC116776749 [Danaus plexippus]
MSLLNSSRSILDIVLDIMDEGPKPMKNLKETEKNRNCVDQFWDAHQSEYEARGRMSEDHVDRVNQHNMTYPKLRKELEKRRSLLKVTNMKRKTSGEFFCANCEACVERCLNDIKKKYANPTQRSRNKRTKKNYGDIKTSLRKNKYRTKRKQNKLEDITSVNRLTSCYYVPVNHKMVGVDSTLNLACMNNMKTNENNRKEKVNKKNNTQDGRIFYAQDMEGMDPGSTDINERMTGSERTNDNSEPENSGKSINTLKNPDTSVASLSSYKSYYSMEHEPMV